MAEKVPAKKSVAKKTPVKKAPAKKAPAKKAPLAPAETAQPQAATADDTLISTPPPTPTALAGEPPPTAVERVLALDWASTARIAVPSGLALIAVSCVVLTPLLMFNNGRGDITLGPSARPSVGDFFQLVAMLSAMALDSSIRIKGSAGFSVIPLTITLTVLAVYGALTRRYLGQGSVGETVGRSLRASVVFAALATVVSAFGRFSVGTGDDRTRVSASPGQTFVWAFLLTAVVSLGVVYGPVLVDRARADDRVWARLRTWRLPVQGGLVALATAILLGGASFIIAAFVETANADGNVLDVARALPIILGFFVNIGITVAAIAMGDSVGGSFEGFGSSQEATIGYAHMHGASPGYFLLLLLPVAATFAGIRWMQSRRQDENVREMARACYRMALPFALGWFFLAIASRVEIGAGGVAAVHVGPQLFLGLVLALGWPGVIGAAYGQVLLRRGEAPATPPPPRSTRPLRFDLTWTQVAGVSIAIIVATAIAAIARHEDSARAGGLLDNLRGGVSSDPNVVTPGPLSADFQAQSLLRKASEAERSYHNRTETYTGDISALGILVPDGVGFSIAYADVTRFCMTATATDTGRAFTYNSDVGTVQEGSTC